MHSQVLIPGSPEWNSCSSGYLKCVMPYAECDSSDGVFPAPAYSDVTVVVHDSRLLRAVPTARPRDGCLEVASKPQGGCSNGAYWSSKMDVMWSHEEVSLNFTSKESKAAGEAVVWPPGWWVCASSQTVPWQDLFMCMHSALLIKVVSLFFFPSYVISKGSFCTLLLSSLIALGPKFSVIGLLPHLLCLQCT